MSGWAEEGREKARSRGSKRNCRDGERTLGAAALYAERRTRDAWLSVVRSQPKPDMGTWLRRPRQSRATNQPRNRGRGARIRSSDSIGSPLLLSPRYSFAVSLGNSSRTAPRTLVEYPKSTRLLGSRRRCMFFILPMSSAKSSFNTIVLNQIVQNNSSKNPTNIFHWSLNILYRYFSL